MTNWTSGPRAATLTGLAVGDALGMPFETQHFLSDQLLSWDGETFGSSAYHKLKPGQWTDDTMMAKCLADSILKNPRFDPSDIAGVYQSWYDSGDHRGMGKTTERALDRLVAGRPWMTSGVKGAEGNGPAMRIAPLGLFYRHLKSRDLIAMAHVEASITHDSDVGRWGAAAVALAVADLANRVVFTSKEDTVNRVIELLPEEIELGGQIRLGLISAVAKSKAPAARRWEALANMGTGAHILQTVPAAFYAFLTAGSYHETIVTAIRAGGDTDTTAAIAGALAGTYYGVEQVARFLPNLEDAETLRALECRLYTEGPRRN